MSDLTGVNDAREVLRQADDLRSKYKHARKIAEVMQPGVRLPVKVGTYEVQAEHVRVMREALDAKASEWLAEAEALEATVVVNR